MTLPDVPVRKLGSQGLQAACMGLGCMGMSAFYKDASGTHSDEESIQTIKRAKEIGVTFLGKLYAGLRTSAAIAETFQRIETFQGLLCARPSTAVYQIIQTYLLTNVINLAQHALQIQSVLPWPSAVNLTGWPSAVVLL